MTVRYAAVWALLTLLLTRVGAAAELRLATMLPRRSSYVKTLLASCDDVARRSEGRVTVRLLTNGVEGDDREVLAKAREGKLDGAIVAGTSLARECPDCLVYSLPLLFRSLDEVEHIRRQRDPKLVAALGERGWVTLGVAGGGFAYILSNAPVRSVAELKERKMWVPPRIEAAEAGEAWGITPVELPIADVRDGLKSGVVDAVVMPPVGAIILQWHTRLRCVTDLPLLYSYTLLVVDKKAFGKLSTADREIVRDVCGRALAELDKAGREHEAKALEILRKQRKTFVAPAGEQLVEWRAWAERVTAQLVAEGRVAKPALEAVRTQLADFRQRGGGRP